MRRADLGTWGAGLPTDKLGSALSAALVLSARPLPRLWHTQSVATIARELLALIRDPGTPSGAVPARLDTALIGDWPPAELLITAWTSVLDDLEYDLLPIRLELEGWQDCDPTWVLGLLRRTAGNTNVCSAFLQRATPGSSHGWHLPLRVGFLPDSESRVLRDMLVDRRYDWLTTLVELRPGVETCDLLMLPHSLRTGLARALDLPFRPAAACTLVLDHDAQPFRAAYPLLQALQAQTSGSALGLLDILSAERVDWFGDLIQELSHDQSLDLALTIAGEWRDIPAPILVADSGFIGRARISATAKTIVNQMVRRGSAGEHVRLPDRLRYGLHTDDLGLTQDGVLLPEGVAGFRDRVFEALGSREFAFNAESGDATDFLELNDAMREVAAPPPEEPRQAQVRVQDLQDRDGPSIEHGALVTGQEYGFDVRVAEPDPEWQGTGKPFPDKEIDFSRGPVELTVIFSEPDLCPEPLTDHIMLPPHDASTECRFVVRVPEGPMRFQARIVFVYRNRVLQTVLVAGRIVAHAGELAEIGDDGIDVSVETMLVPGFDHLADRRQFDAALILNHSGSGNRLAMAITEDRASWVATERYQDTVQLIRDTLTRMSLDIQKDQTLYASLDAPETSALLVDLAINGSELYQALIEDWGLQHLKSAKRIQIVATDFDRFFPLEFFYDREVPDDDARLCISDSQRLEKILSAGHCDRECPGDMAKVICPLGFWCLRCVIERHTFDPQQVPHGRGDYALIPEGPLGDTPPLQPLRNAVFAASKRVDNAVAGQRDQVMAVLHQLVAAKAERAETWGEWEDKVGEVAPSLLLLIPHTVEQRQKRAMEIGQQARLIGARIRREHVRAQESDPPPIVFLLGCETGIDDLNFDSFVAGFRRARAALVITTLSTVLGRHAVPIALAFLTELKSLQQPEPFGETTLAVRQKLFAGGTVAVLTLAVYGDADWLVTA